MLCCALVVACCCVIKVGGASIFTCYALMLLGDGRQIVLGFGGNGWRSVLGFGETFRGVWKNKRCLNLQNLYSFWGYRFWLICFGCLFALSAPQLALSSTPSDVAQEFLCFQVRDDPFRLCLASVCSFLCRCERGIPLVGECWFSEGLITVKNLQPNFDRSTIPFTRWVPSHTISSSHWCERIFVRQGPTPRKSGTWVVWDESFGCERWQNVYKSISLILGYFTHQFV